MIDNKLPPDLVEKMQNCINSLNGIHASEQCAQIAAEWYTKELKLFMEARCILEQQRDELLETLEGLHHIAEEGYVSTFKGSFKKWEEELNRKLREAKQLIEKHQQ